MSKTIETRLQSNEVRIPKKTEFDVSSSAAPSQYFKSSFARSLSFNQGGPGAGGSGGPFGPAGYHFTRSLDFEVNVGLSPIADHISPNSTLITPSASPVFDPQEEQDLVKHVNGGIATSNGGIVKMLWNPSKVSVSIE